MLPILDIYRTYYGGQVALYILATFYVTMAAAGYAVELLFGALGTALGMLPVFWSMAATLAAGGWFAGRSRRAQS